jgi:hypothetical protein
LADLDAETTVVGRNVFGTLTETGCETGVNILGKQIDWQISRIEIKTGRCRQAEKSTSG